LCQFFDLGEPLAGMGAAETERVSDCITVNGIWSVAAGAFDAPALVK
jgi:hypothetical protein